METVSTWFRDCTNCVFLGGFKVFKYLVFCANVVLLVFAIILIAIPAEQIYSHNKNFQSGFTSFNLTTGLIVLGCFLLLLAFFGCCGAAWENRLLLACYFILLFMFIVVEIGLGLGAASFKNNNNLPNKLFVSFQKSTDETKEFLQTQFECCGFWNATDGSAYTPCPDQINNITAPSNLPGCEDKMVKKLTKEAQTVEITALVLGCLQILILILSCCLYCTIPSKKDTEKSYLSEFARSPGIAGSRSRSHYDQI